MLTQEIELALKQCACRKDFFTRYPRLYDYCARHGLLPEIRSRLPRSSGRRGSDVTNEYLYADSARYPSVKAWHEAGIAGRKLGLPCCYSIAVGRGKEVYKKCTAHMTRAVYTKQNTYTDDQVLAASSKYAHINEWKRSADGHGRNMYQVAIRRGPELMQKCTAHMTPMASPFAKDYIIYVYEFSDLHAYVGLTFKPEERKAQHLIKGPVFRHSKVCPNPVYKVLINGLQSPKEAKARECVWIEKYKEEKWIMLNKAPGGGTGQVHTKWTPELLAAEASKYKTRSEFLRKSRGAYAQAVKLGCFDACTAHMPKYSKTDNFHNSFTQEARDKSTELRKGKTLGNEHASKISAGIKAYWAAHRDEMLAARASKSAGRSRGWKLTPDEAAHLGVAEGTYELTDEQKQALRSYRYTRDNSHPREKGWTLTPEEAKHMGVPGPRVVLDEAQKNVLRNYRYHHKSRSTPQNPPCPPTPNQA